jgi:hypothetical protein
VNAAFTASKQHQMVAYYLNSSNSARSTLNRPGSNLNPTAQSDCRPTTPSFNLVRHLPLQHFEHFRHLNNNLNNTLTPFHTMGQALSVLGPEASPVEWPAPSDAPLPPFLPPHNTTVLSLGGLGLVILQYRRHCGVWASPRGCWTSW